MTREPESEIFVLGTKPINDNKAYYFKKAHAISYAMVVVVHMNLLCEQLHSAY